MMVMITYNLEKFSTCFGLSSDVSRNKVLVYYYYLLAYLSSYHEKAINALYELA